MKKLYYILIVLLVVVVGLVMPKVEAAVETFDDDAHYIGYIENYEEDVNGVIIGAWVYIIDSSVVSGRYYWFNPTYFQPDILELKDELIGKILIWNPFDDSGDGDYNGRWWLLLGFEHGFDDIADAYQAGYESGYNDGRSYGYGIGYQDGYGVGQAYGFDQGYAVGRQQGYQSGYEDGYDVGHADGREQVLNSIENMEILYQDIVLPNGVKDEIIDNEILVDKVGMAVLDGSERWYLYKRYDIHLLLYTVTYEDIYVDDNVYENKRLLGDRLPNKSFLTLNNNDEIGVSLHPINSRIYVSIPKTWLSDYSADWDTNQIVNGFKTWLSAQKTAGNPLTIWYQYAEPVEYDLVSLLTNADGSYKDGYNIGYNEGRVHVQRENKSLLSVIPTTIGSIWLMISDFLSYEVFGLNLWSIIMMFAGFSLLILIIKMVI